MPHARQAFLLLTAALFLLACGDPLADTRDVATTLPWRGTILETTRYIVTDQGGKQVAVGTLTIEEGGATSTFSQHYENAEGTDDIKVIADSVTLRPQKTIRTIRTKTLTRDVSADYGADKVHIVITGDPAEDEEIEFPPHAYDIEQSLFIWRTLAFAVGYETQYVVINSNRPTGRVGTVRVVAIEAVTIPGGTFECWRVEATATNDKVIAWYEKDGAHRLVRYETGQFVFELLP